MKQIKTIAEENTQKFDDTVNLALLQGWVFVRRYYTPDNYFVAELEREEITEAERCCENCAHVDTLGHKPPCCDCSEDADKWEPAT